MRAADKSVWWHLQQILQVAPKYGVTTPLTAPLRHQTATKRATLAATHHDVGKVLGKHLIEEDPWELFVVQHHRHAILYPIATRLGESVECQ